MRLRVSAALLFALCLVMAASQPALALSADTRHQPGNWRGIAAQPYVYPDDVWTLQPGGQRISSIYMHTDNWPTNVRHIETGVGLRSSWSSPKVVVQYNYSYSTWNPIQLYPYSLRFPTDWGNAYYVQLEINNASNGNYAPENWRTAYNGKVTAYVNNFMMVKDAASISSERGYWGDSNRSSFRYIKVKNDSFGWQYWTSSVRGLNQDPYYGWRNYSASHWYTYEY